MYRYYNPNPSGRRVDDCVVRAISRLFDISWDQAYDEVCRLGGIMHNMPSANEVWGQYLKEHGFNRYTLPNTCPHCYTISMFCDSHPIGVYALATGSHVVSAINGDYFDSGNSGDEVVAYFWVLES